MELKFQVPWIEIEIEIGMYSVCIEKKIIYFVCVFGFGGLYSKIFLRLCDKYANAECLRDLKTKQLAFLHAECS